MKSAGGTGLVIIGFLFLYLAITGRLNCFFEFISCVTGSSNPAGATVADGGSGGFSVGDLGNIIGKGVDILKNGGTGSSNSGSGGTVFVPSPGGGTSGRFIHFN